MIQKIYSQFIFYDFQIINESGEGKSTQSKIKLEKILIDLKNSKFVTYQINKSNTSKKEPKSDIEPNNDYQKVI